MSVRMMRKTNLMTVRFGGGFNKDRVEAIMIISIWMILKMTYNEILQEWPLHWIVEIVEAIMVMMAHVIFHHM